MKMEIKIIDAKALAIAGIEQKIEWKKQELKELKKQLADWKK
jgi:hypothetical protein